MGDQLTLQTNSITYTRRKIWDILDPAATRQQSVHRTYCELADAPTRAVVFNQLRHGQAQKDEKEIRRSKAKSGTTHFHMYASAYILTPHKQVTVAITYWQAEQSVKHIFDRLMACVKSLPLRIKWLLLDREFCNVAVAHYLQTRLIRLRPILQWAGMQICGIYLTGWEKISHSR